MEEEGEGEQEEDGAEEEGALTQARWITETLESTVGAGLSRQDMGTGAEWKLSPLTLRHPGKLPVLNILKKKRKKKREMVN